MKRLLLLVALSLPLMALAQPTGFGKLIKKYQSKQGYTTIELSKDMLRTMGASDGIEQMMAITADNSQSSDEFTQDIEAITKDMNTMLSVNSNDSTVNIYSRADKQGRVCELVIHTADGYSIVAVNLTGTDIKLNDAQSLINF